MCGLGSTRQGGADVRLEDMLQELHYQGVLKEGDRWTFSG